jgi:hypothetical protein
VTKTFIKASSCPRQEKGDFTQSSLLKSSEMSGIKAFE